MFATLWARAAGAAQQAQEVVSAALQRVDQAQLQGQIARVASQARAVLEQAAQACLPPAPVPHAPAEPPPAQPVAAPPPAALPPQERELEEGEPGWVCVEGEEGNPKGD
jgi:hypothetical protein